MHPSQPISTSRSVRDLENLQRESPQDYYALVLQSIHLPSDGHVPLHVKERLQNTRWITEKGIIPIAIRTLIIDKVNGSKKEVLTELISLDDLEFWTSYFKEANALASFFLQILEKYNIAIDRLFTHSLFFGPKPYCYIAANGGIALQFKNGLPQSFWTPFGKYTFNTSDAQNQKVWDEIISSEIKLEFVFNNHAGIQIFSIKKGLNGRTFPSAILKPHGFLPSEQWYDFVFDCNNRWLCLRKALLPAAVLRPITEEMTPSEKARCCVHNLQLYFQENRSEAAGSAQINFRSPRFSRVGVISPGGTVSFEDRITFSNDLESPDLQPIADYILQNPSGNWYKNLRQFEQEWKRELVQSFYARPAAESDSRETSAQT